MGLEKNTPVNVSPSQRLLMYLEARFGSLGMDNWKARGASRALLSNIPSRAAEEVN